MIGYSDTITIWMIKLHILRLSNLLNINKYVLEKIHISTNNYCRYVDPKLFPFLLIYNPDDNKQ